MRERVLVTGGFGFLGGHLRNLADVETSPETFSRLAGSEAIAPRAKGEGRHPVVHAQ